VATVPAHLGVLQIEPTDHCNLACRMCAPHAEHWPSVHGVPKGFLDVGRFERLLDTLVEEDCRFDHVILQWLGDPAVHPRLEDLVVSASHRLADRMGYLRFDTNGILLGPERQRRLFAERRADVPLLVVFTLDAVTADTYATTKGVDALDRARRNVRHLLAERRRAGADRVSVQVQFVVQPTNHDEAGEFLRYWEDAFACLGGGVGHGEILFKRLSVSGGAAGQAAADRLYEDTMSRFGIAARREANLSVTVWEDRPWQRDDAHARRGACPGAWFTPVIRHDGHLLLCCADLAGTLDLGSVDERGFRALWNGPRARGIRRDHLAGRFEGACATCGGINWYALPEGAGDLV
jgi:MoaA/NifB/PqqE/SkfB family radical SAM enzyme